MILAQNSKGFTYCVENYGPQYYVAFVLDYYEHIFPKKSKNKSELMMAIRRILVDPDTSERIEDAWRYIKEHAYVQYPGDNPTEPEYFTADGSKYEFDSVDGCIIFRDYEDSSD